MIKNNKFKTIISSAIILVPIAAGLLLWDKLPDKIATHWDFSGNADGFSSKPFAVFFMPLFLLAMHLICLAVSSFDKANRKQNKKVLGLVFWICPVISLFTNAAVYSAAMGINFNIGSVALIVMGIAFAIIGNYLPKTTQNRTIGIKIKWTLESEENWNATHRFGGKVWAIGGVVLILSAFLPKAAIPFVLIVILPILVITPIVYSYLYHKKIK